jgi:hypothetical protein
VYTFKLRRGTSSDWATTNPILEDGEPGIEIDTNKLKIGDGIHHWLDLGYFSVTVTLVPAANWPPAPDSNPLHLYFRVP